MGFQTGIDFPGRPDSDRRFVLTVIRSPIQNAARQVRVFNAIQIGDQDMADAQQRKIFENLIAERAGTDHQHFCIGELFLIPPADELEAVESIVLGGGRVGGGDFEAFCFHGCRSVSGGGWK